VSVLRVDVRGIPRPQPRGRAVRTKKGARIVSTLRDSPAARWKRLVLAELRDAVEAHGWETLTGAVRLRVVTRYATRFADRWWKPRVVVRNADVDNVLKLAMDAMTVRGVFGDDGQVAVLEQWQVWVPPGQDGMTIEVEAVAGGVWEWARLAWPAEGVALDTGASRVWSAAGVAETEAAPVGADLCGSRPGWLG
jgi:Holliday junction resolvase RusA-like endonuclease